MDQHREFIEKLLREGGTKGGTAKRIKALGYYPELSVNAIRKRIHRAVNRWNIDSNDTVTDTNQYETDQQLSALKPDGTIMDIKEWCDNYGIPYAHAKSYKLVSHTGVPYYNIASVNLNEVVESVDVEQVISRVLSNVSVRKREVAGNKNVEKGDLSMFVVLSDIHVGMEPNGDGRSLYGDSVAWKKENIINRSNEVLRKVSELSSMYKGRISEANIVILGDTLDGLNKQTVRMGHDLPQNMSNEEMFENALELQLRLVDGVVTRVPSRKYMLYNVSNSNHSDFGDYVVARAAEESIKHIYSGKVSCVSELKFIGHTTHGNWTHLWSHGKDGSHLKFGLKPRLDEKGKGYIEDYLKYHNLYGTDRNIMFHSGDSHQRLVDTATSPDFTYSKYFAFSPPSGWVQGNFGRGRSGFTILIQELEGGSIVTYDYEFKFGTDKLK